MNSFVKGKLQYYDTLTESLIKITNTIEVPTMMFPNDILYRIDFISSSCRTPTDTHTHTVTVVHANQQFSVNRQHIMQNTLTQRCPLIKTHVGKKHTILLPNIVDKNWSTITWRTWSTAVTKLYIGHLFVLNDLPNNFHISSKKSRCSKYKLPLSKWKMRYIHNMMKITKFKWLILKMQSNLVFCYQKSAICALNGAHLFSLPWIQFSYTHLCYKDGQKIVFD